jgi:hypothetical protein
LGSNVCHNTSVSYYFLFLYLLICIISNSVDYEDDDGPSSFATLNPTTPSYSHLTDTLSSGLGNSNSGNSSSISNSSSAMTSNVNSILNSNSGPTSVSSTNAYSPYSNHPTPSPAMQMDYQRKI